MKLFNLNKFRLQVKLKLLNDSFNGLHLISDLIKSVI